MGKIISTQTGRSFFSETDVQKCPLITKIVIRTMMDISMSNVAESYEPELRGWDTIEIKDR